MNNNDMIIRIITEEAKEIEASVISLFEIKDTNSKYAIYTFNEEDAQGLVKIYASRVVLTDGLYSFASIHDSEEWGRIKAIMKYMAKETDNDDGTDGGKIELIPVEEIKAQMNEPISVNLSETKAAKIGPNYKSGITNNYIKNARSVKRVVTPTPVVEPKVEKVVPSEINIEQPQIEVTPVEIPQETKEEPMVQEMKIDNSFKSEEPKIEMPELDISIPNIPIVEPKASPSIPSFNPEPIHNDFSFEKEEIAKEEPKMELPKAELFEKPKYSFEESKFEDNNIVEGTDFEEPKEEIKSIEKEVPSVDSVLNKASYFQNIKEEEPKKEDNNENIIQSIGLEFMKKVSELAEYEKDLNKRNRDLEAKERLLTKLEKEMASKEEKQKRSIQTTKEKEMELRKIEKELADKDNDLNRRIMEFNKKISMFQQTFETISKVD